MSQDNEMNNKRPTLYDLPLLDNMANIDKLEKQLEIRWPEFSWVTGEENNNVRAYRMFAPDISRIGYDESGRVYSIICPQQGVYSELYGTLNIEVTVTSQRGNVNEDGEVWADLTVEPKIWFSPSARDYGLFMLLEYLFDKLNLSFPIRKSDAIRIKTYLPGDPNNPILQGNPGMDESIKPPKFAQHQKEAWNVANLALGVGEQFKTGCGLVDLFNQLVMDMFNYRSMNLLAPGGIVSWNVWFKEPTEVDHCEWYRHADVWRRSIDTGHGSPDGPGRPPEDYDGNKLEPKEDDFLKHEFSKFIEYLIKYLDDLLKPFDKTADNKELRSKVSDALNSLKAAEHSEGQKMLEDLKNKLNAKIPKLNI